jgi:hypothetical protein
MEKFFENDVEDSTLTEIFSPPLKVPMPFLYTSFWLSLKESLKSEVFSLFSVTIGNKLKTDRTRLSTRNTIVTKRRILVVPGPLIESAFYPRLKIGICLYLILLHEKKR